MGSPDDIGGVPDDVRELLAERIGGFEALELLRLFCGEPTRPWTASLAAEALRVPDAIVGSALEELKTHELIVPVVGSQNAYIFQPATPALRAACEALCKLYADDRMSVVMLMSRLAFERIRRSTARAFADAFRIRNPRKGDDPDA